MKKLVYLLILSLCVNGLAGASLPWLQSARAASKTEEKSEKKSGSKDKKEKSEKKVSKDQSKENGKDSEKTDKKAKKTKAEKEKEYTLDLAKNGQVALSVVLEYTKMDIKLKDVKSIELVDEKDKKRIRWEKDKDKENDYIFTVLKNFKELRLRVVTKKSSRLLVLKNGVKYTDEDREEAKSSPKDQAEDTEAPSGDKQEKPDKEHKEEADGEKPETPAGDQAEEPLVLPEPEDDKKEKQTKVENIEKPGKGEEQSETDDSDFLEEYLGPVTEDPMDGVEAPEDTAKGEGEKTKDQEDGTKAPEDGAEGEGDDTKAPEDGAEGEGDDTKAPEDGAEGEGDDTKAPEDGAEGEGDDTKTPADGSEGEGDDTKAPEDGAEGEGDDTKVPEDGSEGEGDDTKAPEDGSEGEGDDTKAPEDGAEGEGDDTKTPEDGTEGEGDDTKTPEDGSEGDGDDTKTPEDGAEGEGDDTKTPEDGSEGEGDDTKAPEDGDEGEGDDTKTPEDGAEGEGDETKAPKDGTEGEGDETKAPENGDEGEEGSDDPEGGSGGDGSGEEGEASQPETGASIPEEAEAWFKRGTELLWGSMKEIIGQLTGEETVYIQTEKLMLIKEAPTQLLSTVTLLPDGDAFKGSYSVRVSTDNPALVSAPTLLRPEDLPALGDMADLYIWVKPDEETSPEEEGEEEEKPTLTVTATGLEPSGWSKTQPQFTLSGIPEGKQWSYAAIIYDERIVPIASNAFAPDQEGIFTLRFAMLNELGDIMAASEQYTLQLDWTAPEVSIEVDEENSYTLIISATDKASGLDAVSVDKGKTWEPIDEEGYTVTEKEEKTFKAGDIMVRDVAGNVFKSEEEYTVQEAENEEGEEEGEGEGEEGDGGGGGGGGGGGSRTPALPHSRGDGEEGVDYDALALDLPDEPMEQLTVGGEPMELTLKLTAAQEADAPVGANQPFTGRLCHWKDASNSDALNTLLLEAEIADDLGDSFTYEWHFNGEVYRMLANSGIKYVALKVDDTLAAFPTEGFTGGTRYTELKMQGVSTRKFDYTLAMKLNLDPSHVSAMTDSDYSQECDLSILAKVEETNYELSNSPQSVMYFYNVFLGPEDMMNQPFGEYRAKA